MRLIWLSYFDLRKDGKTVWWRSEDLTDARMATPYRRRGTPHMKRPLKGQIILTYKKALASYL
jgi:hypothetical protein